MEFPALRGRSILVVEDELLIGIDIRSALEDAGAHVTSTTTARHALILAEHDGLAGAIMDHALADGDSTELCARLSEDPAAAHIADEPENQLTFEPVGDGADLRGAPSRVGVRPQIGDGAGWLGAAHQPST